MAGRNWLWNREQLNDTPSRKKGIDINLEDRLRREGVNIIMQVGGRLRLKANPTLATACVYFHRFYMFHSFDDFQRELVALGCIFLAGKVEETPKKCRDLCQNAMEMDVFQRVYEPYKNNLVDEVMGIERVLLQTLKFDLQIEHPYRFLLQYFKKFDLPQEESNKVVQTAWTFVNDSLSTTLCLLWEPQVIAVSLIYLARTVQNHAARDEVPWWEEFVSNLSSQLIDNICHTVLDFYTIMKEEKLFEPPHPLFFLQKTQELKQVMHQQQQQQMQQMPPPMMQMAPHPYQMPPPMPNMYPNPNLHAPPQ